MDRKPTSIFLSEYDAAIKKWKSEWKLFHSSIGINYIGGTNPRAAKNNTISKHFDSAPWPSNAGWYDATKELGYDGISQIRMFAMNLSARAESMNNSISEPIRQMLLAESRIEDKTLFEYGAEFCHVRDNVLTLLGTLLAPSGVYYGIENCPSLTAVYMTDETHPIARYSYPSWFFSSPHMGDTEDWKEMWQTKLMDDYEYNRRKDLSTSNFVLMYAKATISQIQSDLSKLVAWAKTPFSKDYTVFANILSKGPVKHQYCMMRSGRGALPSVIILCGVLEIDGCFFDSVFNGAYENSILQNALKVQMKRHNFREQELKALEESRTERERRVHFNRYNGHLRDKRIKVVGRDYLLNNKKLDSISAMVSSLFPRFDSLPTIKKHAEIQGVSIDDIRKQWKDKAAKTVESSNRLIDDIETWFKGKSSVRSIPMDYFLEFAMKTNISPYRTKWHIYDTNETMAGTIDLAENSKNGLIIYAITTKDHIIKNGLPVKLNEDGETALPPIAHIPNVQYYIIAIKMSFFKYILETSYGEKVAELRLGVFCENNSKPYVLRLPYLQKEIESILEMRNDLVF